MFIYMIMTKKPSILEQLYKDLVHVTQRLKKIEVEIYLKDIPLNAYY